MIAETYAPSDTSIGCARISGPGVFPDRKNMRNAYPIMESWVDQGDETVKIFYILYDFSISLIFSKIRRKFSGSCAPPISYMS